MADVQETKVGTSWDDVMSLLHTITSDFNKRYNEVIESQKQIIEKMEEWKRDTDKLNENKNDQVIDDKVSDDVNISDNGDIIKDVVVESKVMNNGSYEESLMGVEVNDEVTVVNEIERVCEESLDEYVGERANFPCGVSGVKTPQLFYEDKGCLLYTSRCV